MNSNFIAVLAFSAWGLLPVFFKFMHYFSAIEIMIIRVVFSFLLLGIFLYVKSDLKNSFSTFKDPKLVLKIMFSAFLIGTNWFLFVYAIDSNQILQTSFGYFISPILSIILGAFVLGEKLGTVKIIASFFFVLSIIIQALDFTQFPWLSLIISFSFAFYGLMRKYIKVPVFQAIFLETFFMLLASLIYIIFFWSPTTSTNYLDWYSIFLYIGSGLFTLIPMLLFTKAAQGLEISTLGIIQFISPSLQFILAAFIYNELMSTYKWSSFIIIWLACFLVAYASISGKKKI